MSWLTRKFFALILVALFVAPAPLSAKCKLNTVAELPISMDGNRPTVAVKLNGHDSRLILDSGAFFSIISGATAEQFGLKLTEPPGGLYVTGVGGATHTRMTVVKDFGLMGSTLHNTVFLVGGSSEATGVGLLGQNLLSHFDVEYDLAHGIVRLFETDDCDKTVLAYWAAPGQSYSVVPILPLEKLNPHTLGSATVNGKYIRVMFDTGAYTSILSLKAAERAGVTPSSPGVTDGGYSYGIGQGSTKSYVARFDSFKIGDSEEIKNAKLRIGEVGGDKIDMLLGADFFLSHRLFVSNKDHKAYLTFNGGAVFDLSTGSASAPASEEDHRTPAVSSDASNDPAELARLGEGFAARQDYAHALADLSKALTLKPDEPEYFYRRALVYTRTGNGVSALADFDQVLKLNQNFLPAYIPRAEIRYATDGKDAALVDLASVDRLAPKQADLRLDLAYFYSRLDDSSAAISQFNYWIDSHPQDGRLLGALGSRCLMRVQLNQDMGLALDDCSKALRRADLHDPNNAELFAYRGLVRVRQGDYEKSLADFNSALKLKPQDALALFGRGVAESHQHQPTAEADLTAARKLDDKLQQRFQGLGITP